MVIHKMEYYVGAKKNNLYKLIWSEFQDVLSGKKMQKSVYSK